MKSKYLFILISVFYISVTGCNKKASLKKLSDDSDSLQTLFNLANEDKIPYAKRHEYAERAFSIISKADNDSITRVNYFKVANRFFNMNAMEDYRKTVDIIIPKANQAKDTLSLAKSNEYLGDYFGKKFQSEKAYSYYFDAEKLYSVKKEYAKTAKVVLNKAIIQLNEKDFVGSEKSVFKALKLLQKENDEDLRYQGTNILGIIYDELAEYRKSIEYYNKALQIASTGNVSVAMQAKATTLNNLGALYQKEHKYKEALGYFNQSLQQEHLYEDNPLLYGNLKYNIGYSMFKLNDYSLLPKLYYDALKIADSLQFAPNIIACNLNLSEFYLVQSDTSRAYDFASKAYFLAKTNRIPKDILTSLKQLALSNPKKKSDYSEQYIKITDSLQLAERQIRNKLGRIEYETDQLVTEKANLVEQRKTLIYIALGIILIGVFIFVIRFQAAKNRELRLVQEQQAANEEIYRLMITQQDKVEETRQAEKRRIAQEIHDGVLGKLFGTRMHLGLLNDKEGNDAKMERVVYIDELKTLEQELREISHDLNSEKQAVANNFVQMVMHFIDTQRTVCKAEITITMDKTIEWTAVDSLAKINLYRILQEAFQNVNKHAQANQVNVVFDKTEGQVRLVIQDDGVGFNYTKKKKGIGMLNMRSRISSSGGSMDVITGLGQGTLLEFTLPMEDVVV
ncbi:MAG: sensor histidine kinase [Flavobacterium sp. BFFFF1]|nr:MAG: sensor histidine kinase [Flavobacterium sp. BFFFF1]